MKYINYFKYEPLLDSSSSPRYKNLYIFKNRYVRGFIYLAVCLLTTIIYYGWQDFQTLLYRNGAYEWVCEGILDNSKDFKCEEQYREVQKLYQIARSSEFIVAVIAGYLIDRVGPLLTSMMGNSMLLAGWLLVAYAGKSSALYRTGFIFLGGYVNMIAFPCLEIGVLFPKYTATALSSVVAAQTGSTFVSLVLRIISDQGYYSVRQIIWGFLLLIAFPLFVLSLLSFPLKRLSLSLENEIIGKHQNKDQECGISNIPLQHQPAPENSEKYINIHGCVSEKNEINEKAKIEKETEKGDHNSKYYYCPEPSTISKNNIQLNMHETKMTITTFFSSLQQNVLSLKFSLFLVYFVIEVMRFGYYPTIIKLNFYNEVSDFQGYILPTQMIMGILMGVLVEYIGILFVCETISLIAIVAFCMAYANAVFLQYISVTLFTFADSYLYTVKYIYIEKYFTQTHFGLLIGVLSVAGGSASFLNIPFEDFPFKTVLAFYIGVSITISMSILIYLHAYYLKKKNEIKTYPSEKERPEQ